MSRRRAAALAALAPLVLAACSGGGDGDDGQRARPAAALFEVRPVLDAGPEPCAADALALDGECLRTGPAEVDADDVEEVRRGTGTYGSALRVRLTEQGVSKLNTFAAGHLRERVVIVLDGKALAAPVVQSADFEDEMVITGGYTDDEVDALFRAFTDEP